MHSFMSLLASLYVHEAHGIYIERQKKLQFYFVIRHTSGKNFESIISGLLLQRFLVILLNETRFHEADVL